MNNTNKMDHSLHEIKNDSYQQNLTYLQYSMATNSTKDLYLPSSGLASFFLIFNLTLSIPCIYFHFLILRMVSREKKKIGETLHGGVLAIYAKCVIFVQLMFTINTNGIMSYIYPASEVLGSWYCYTIEITFHAMAVYVGVFSLLIAAMKYWFVVHNKKAKELGIERAQTISITIHLLSATILPLLNAVSNGDVDRDFWVNQCWGHPEVRNSEVDNNLWQTVREEFCYFRTYQIDYYIGKRASEFLEPCLRVLCGTLPLFYLLFLSNIIELIIYWKLLKYIDR